MSKNYKKKREEIEVIEEQPTLSKKEQYDLEKKKKQQTKMKTEQKTKKVKKSHHTTNLGAKIFAVIMLVLMIGSVIVSAFTYFTFK